MWERILVPLDGSEVASRILGLVQRIARRHNVLRDEDDGRTEVALLRVVSPDETRQSEVFGSNELADARRDLESKLELLGPVAVDASCDVVVGDPAEAILRVAEQWRPSLIALSTHGRSRVERRIRGSVAEQILRASPCPLLLADPFALDASRIPAVPFKNVLVPLDGSEASNKILPHAAALARFFYTDVTLLHVLPSGRVATGTALGAEAGRERDASAALRLAVETFSECRVRVKITRGLPAAAIEETLAHGGSDLLAMRANARSGSSRSALGSVAEDVCRQVGSPLYLLPAREWSSGSPALREVQSSAIL